MKKLLFLIFLIPLIGLLTGCNPIKDIDDAKQLGQQYYETLASKDFNKAMSFYSPQFFTKTSETDTLQALNGVNAKLGDLQSFKCINWKVNSYAGTNGSYTRYNLDYETTYSKGTAKETLTIEKDNSKMQILGFNINSIDLVK